MKSGIADRDAIRVEDLAQTLGGKGSNAEIRKRLYAAKSKSKILPKPLEKPIAARVNIFIYEHIELHINRFFV